MMHSLKIHRSVPALVLCVALAPAWAQANIIGFGNFSGFTLNQGDNGAVPTVSPGAIQLTNTSFAERRSLFYNTPQEIAQFTAAFTYRAESAGLAAVVFVLHNDPAGPQALGGVAAGLGYSGITKSVGLTLQVDSGIIQSSKSGMYTNGVIGGGSAVTSPVDFVAGHPIHVLLAFDGSLLQTRLVDSVTSATFERNYLVNIPSILGGPTAWVGFTSSSGGTIGINGANQHLSDFAFNNVPEPASLLLLAVGACVMGGFRRRNSTARRNT